MKKITTFLKIIATPIWMATLTSFAGAQEGIRTATTMKPQIAIASTSPTPTKVCDDRTVILLLDVTGSFVDHLVNKDLFTNSIKRIRSDFPTLCIDSEVKVAIIGQSHRNVTETYDHLASKNYKVTRNHYTAENVATAAIQLLEKWKEELASGKMKPQKNTAVVMAFDNVAELVQLRGKRAIIWAITDGDDSELGGVAAPFKPNLLTGATIYMFGAGVTLTGGTAAQRALRTEWERYFSQAGAEKFFWVSKP